MGRFDAVLFDAGQTLVRVEPSVGDVYARVARDYGVEVEAAALEGAFRTLWKRLRPAFPDNSGYRTSEDEERAWWRAMVEAVHVETDTREAFGARFEDYFHRLFELFARPEPWHVFDDVEPVLRALEREGIRRGVVSNWDHRLHVLLEGLGLKGWFEFVLTSAEAGWRKPHPHIFAQAIERLGLPASRVAYVGDSYDDDVVGAQEAGLTPFLLDRRRDRSTRDCLAGLEDLLRYL